MTQVSRRLRIVLAEEHGIVREGIRRLIDAEQDMRVVAEAVDGDEALLTVRALSPDVLLVEPSIARLDGVELTRQIARDMPAVRVLALTLCEDPDYVRAMVDAGAHGYVLKRGAPEDLFLAIRKVVAGGVYLDSRLAATMTASWTTSSTGAARGPLSERQARVLMLISEGYSQKDVAAQLGVSVKSVETYKFRAMEKLGLRSRVDVVRYIRESHAAQPSRHTAQPNDSRLD